MFFGLPARPARAILQPTHSWISHCLLRREAVLAIAPGEGAAETMTHTQIIHVWYIYHHLPHK